MGKEGNLCDSREQQHSKYFPAGFVCQSHGELGWLLLLHGTISFASNIDISITFISVFPPFCYLVSQVHLYYIPSPSALVPHHWGRKIQFGLWSWEATSDIAAVVTKLNVA